MQVRLFPIEPTSLNSLKLRGKAIPNANFSLCRFDKYKARISDGVMTLRSVDVGQTVK
jgi:hypothetical protein